MSSPVAGDPPQAHLPQSDLPLGAGTPLATVSGASVRAIVTGMLIGALLTPCNVYSGLKIGWSFNMSITAALLSFAFWRLAEDLAGAQADDRSEAHHQQRRVEREPELLEAERGDARVAQRSRCRP